MAHKGKIEIVKEEDLDLDALLDSADEEFKTKTDEIDDYDDEHVREQILVESFAELVKDVPVYANTDHTSLPHNIPLTTLMADLLPQDPKDLHPKKIDDHKPKQNHTTTPATTTAVKPNPNPKSTDPKGTLVKRHWILNFIKDYSPIIILGIGSISSIFYFFLKRNKF